MAKPSVATAIPGVRSVCHGGTSHRAAEKVRADSFVVETNIHYPTESSLLLDSVRKVIELIATLSNVYQLAGWRQHEHFLTKVKRTARQINRLSSRKGADYQKQLQEQYRKLLHSAESILSRASETCEALHNDHKLNFTTMAQIAEIKLSMRRTQQACGTARRRVLQGEKGSNEDKLFSISNRTHSCIGAAKLANSISTDAYL